MKMFRSRWNFELSTRWSLSEVNVSDTVQKWIAIIEMTGHKEQLQVILHYPDQEDGEYAANPTGGKSMSYMCERKVNVLSKITPRFRTDLSGLVLTPKRPRKGKAMSLLWPCQHLLMLECRYGFSVEAISVEWNLLYEDWCWLDVFELFIREFSWFTTTFPRTLKRKLRSDNGR